MALSKISLKIALPIVIAGLFIMIIFVALNYEKLDFNFYIIFIFLSIYIFLFGFATGQNFSSPLKKLLKRATELSEGDLKTRVYLETKDEIGELADIFNKIANELEESYSAGKRAEQSIDIKVKARTQALEETINALEQKVKNRTIELEKIMAEANKMKDETKNRENEVTVLKSELTKLKEDTSDYQDKKTIAKKPKIDKSSETLNEPIANSQIEEKNKNDEK